MSIQRANSVNRNTAKSQSEDAFSVHPSFTYQDSHSYVTLYKRRPSSFFSKIKSLNLSKAGDVISVLLWAVSIPVIFSLGSIVVV